MEIRNWLWAGFLLAAAPAWIGSIWCYFAGMHGRIKNLLFAWVSGFMTVMAVSQLMLVPLVLRRYSFAVYRNAATVVYLTLMVMALILNWKRLRAEKLCRTQKIIVATAGRKIAETDVSEKSDLAAGMETAGIEAAETDVPEKSGAAADMEMAVTEKKESWNIWQVLYLIGALGLILLQAVVAGIFQHIDDDDSRFVVEQVMAVEHGAMYTENPVTGKPSYWDMGEVRKDMISPWAMLVAYWCKLSKIAPAVMSHKYMPFYLILLTYAVYALLGMHFWKKDREKVSIFLIFVSALNIYGYFSTHTTSAILLLRIWQGKALAGAMLLPAVFYIMFEIMSGKGKKMWYFLGAVAATAAALASGSGITITPVVIGICGLAELIHTRKIKKGILIWCTAIPSVIYLLCYLFFWQLLKVYF